MTAIALDTASEIVVADATFADLGLAQPLLDALRDAGYERPTPIQRDAIPIALKGVAYTPSSASALLTRNLLVYGLGGLIVPFIGIKAIDLAVNALGLA